MGEELPKMFEKSTDVFYGRSPIRVTWANIVHIAFYIGLSQKIKNRLITD